MNLSQIVRRNASSVDDEDFSEWTYPEMVALLVTYVDLNRSLFASRPRHTKRVKAMARKYPATGTKRPMPVPTLLQKVLKMSKSQKTHPLDISPALDGKNFVSITLAGEKAAAVYTDPASVRKVVLAERTAPFDLGKVGELKPRVVCHYGIAATGDTQEACRKQRVAAICQSLIVPGKGNRGMVASITASPEGFSDESLAATSAVLGAAFSGMTGKTRPNHLFDYMLKDKPIYDYMVDAAGERLAHTVYGASLGENGELVETSTPPEFEEFVDPISAVVALVPGIHPKTIGRTTANALDGLVVDHQLRTRMNKVADIYVPTEARIVYLDLADRNLATQLQRRERGKRMVVFYKATEYQQNEPLMVDYFETTGEAPNLQYKVKKSGVIPYFGTFYSPDPSVTLYVNLSKTTASNVTPKSIEEGTRRVMEKDYYKFTEIPESKWFLVRTHVYSLNPAMYVEAAPDLPGYGDFFYVSRNFQSCNVLNTNFQVPGVESFSCEKILHVFVHVLRCAMSYPISRTPCMEIVIDQRLVNLIPPVTYYPFSNKEEVAQLHKVLQRARNKPEATSFGTGIFGDISGGDDERSVASGVPESAKKAVRKSAPAKRKKAVPISLLTAFKRVSGNVEEGESSEEDDDNLVEEDDLGEW